MKKILQNIYTPMVLKTFIAKTLSAKKKSNQIQKDKQLIMASGYFSPEYYLSAYQDIKNAGIDPLTHFCQYGWKEDRNPGPAFKTRAYASMYADVAQSGINPLVHYLKYGQDEGRQTGADSDLPELSPEEKKKSTLTPKKGFFSLPKRKNKKYQGPTYGLIDSFENGQIKGWFASANEASIPVIRINKRPTRNTAIKLNSSGSHDVFKFIQDIGFNAEALSSTDPSPCIELLSLTEEGITPVYQKRFDHAWVEPNKYTDLEKARRISKQKDAVAITVWEGAHNPIGRAKVLYDIVASSNRPVVIFAYIFGDFGHDLWGPLRNSGLNVVLIPYAERYSYQSYIQEQAIKFDTVWICKHRLHSFELASMIAKPDTACILDMDDNEEVFVSSKTSELKPYGIFTKNKANYYLNRTTTRSVASISIQNAYGGEIIRHARQPNLLAKPFDSEKATITAVFIGTIRAHKNICDLVDAVKAFNTSAPEKITLAIGGNFNPSSLRQKLDTPDTLILDEIANEDLYETLAGYDIVITGYPDKNNENLEINKLQITSKIGDGLAIGRPVLSPYSPSVDDLKEVPGLFLFNRENFGELLQQAMAYRGEINLPDHYTLNHSYKTFKQLESVARKESKANDIFGLEPLFNYQKNKPNTQDTHNNIVLIWKQHDSGVYGRRIDHIARYYKQKHPNDKVTIIEIMDENSITNFVNSKQQFDNSTVIINDVLSQKLYRYSLEGVEYRLLPYKEKNGWNSFEEKFKCFLSTENINPNNAVLILFPLHPVFNKIISIISEYKTIIDLVDNQIKWITKPEKRIEGLKQYYDLLSIADEVVSNSPQNMAYFKGLNFLDDITPQIIPNWYTLPDSVSFKRNTHKDEINLIYSGNMNDRIDWDLFNSICKRLEQHNGYLHIVGSTIRRAEEMQKLLNNTNCVYHGVINEKQLLSLLQHINFAVIPHAEDSISKFMDPIKLKMYKKLGIKSLTTKLPGLPMDEPLLVVAESREDFLQKLSGMLDDFSAHSVYAFNTSCDDETGNRYSNLINDLLQPRR